MLDDPATPAHTLIVVGQFITDELQARHPGRYARWLTDSVGGLRVADNRAVRAIERLGVRVATTNYDGLIEDASLGLKSPITWRRRQGVIDYFRGVTPTVLHLHGYYREPDSIILGARSYGEVCTDPLLQPLLRDRLRLGTFVFVGCGRGLYDPNFGSLLKWARTELADFAYEHFILVPTPEVGAWTTDLSGLPIHPVGYGQDHAALVPYLEDLARSVSDRRLPRPLAALTSSQNDFDAQWAVVAANRDTLPVAECFRQFRDIARQLAQAGGVHRAAMSFSSEVTYRGEGLIAGEYVEFALDAAEWLLDDDVAELAQHHLDRAGRHVRAGEIPASQVERYFRLHLRVLDALCAYNETLQANADLLTRATGEERERLEAERAEIHLLQGEFDRVAGEES